MASTDRVYIMSMVLGARQEGREQVSQISVRRKALYEGFLYSGANDGKPKYDNNSNEVA